MRRKDTEILTFKPCPRCGGLGIIPCTGREPHMKKALEWAESLHGKMVTIPFLSSMHPETWIRIPGLAITHIGLGGWGNARVYISIDRGLNWGGFWPLIKPGTAYDEQHDEIEGRRIYYIDKGFRQRNDVEILSLERDLPALKKIKVLAIK